MNQFKPHPGAAFEGYYSKFRLPSGASLALIVSSVFDGTSRQHMVSFTYVPSRKSHPDSKVDQRETWTKKINYVETAHDSFVMNVDGMGTVTCTGDEVVYDLKNKEFQFEAKTIGKRIPWMPKNPSSTPAGLLTYLPLPIQWHVHTLSTEASFKLGISGTTSLAEEDKSGICSVHVEKNWALSFPKSYIWIQGLSKDNTKGICIAGGNAIGPLEAYLIGYRDGDEAVQFRPPFTVALMGYSPFLSTTRVLSDGYLTLQAQSFFKKIVITAKTDPSTFFTLSAPLPEGHRPKFCAQSFETDIKVELYTSWLGLGPWQKTKEDQFESGSLEFGGEYYTHAVKPKSE